MVTLAHLARGAVSRFGLRAILIASLLGAAAPASTAAAPPAATTACQLPGNSSTIKHVVEIQFDNTHFTRDNPNVPSDLEQLPNLLNFMTRNGTLLTDHHTPLISHTGTDILTTLTGVYGDRHGQPVANSFRYFNPDGTSQSAGTFAYWTSVLNTFGTSPTDVTPRMISPQGAIAPAPWVPFTRAGCDFGAVATANVVLENTSRDVATIFGANSPQQQEAISNITTTWLGLVGPGVQKLGTSGDVWSDHADIRPTVLALTGLKDDYSHQGRVLYEVLASSLVPASINAGDLSNVEQLMASYKQLNAPVGEFALATLTASTTALSSGSATDDSTYTSLESQISSLAASRSSLATQIEAALENAEFNNVAIDPNLVDSLDNQANDLIDQANNLNQHQQHFSKEQRTGS